jgi:hypothetical protein
MASKMRIELQYCASYVVYVKTKGMLYIAGNFLGIFTENFELHDFPFDVQCLTVQIKLWGGGVSASQDYGRLLVPVVSRADRISQHPEWICHEPLCESRGEVHEKQLLEITLVMTRQSAHYVKEIMAIGFLLTSATFSAFALHPQLSDTSGIVLTLLLTIVAFKFTISNKLPKLAYQTRIDVYMNGCLYCIMLIFLESIIAHCAYTIIGNAATYTWIGGITCSSLWVLFNLWFAWHVYRDKSRNKELAGPLIPMREEKVDSKLVKMQEQASCMRRALV